MDKGRLVSYHMRLSHHHSSRSRDYSRAWRLRNNMLCMCGIILERKIRKITIRRSLFRSEHCFFMQHKRGEILAWKVYLLICNLGRLRVVPHFSSGIVERAKRERAWKSPHARKARLFSRGLIFTRARVLLALLSLRDLRKNGGLLVVYNLGLTLDKPVLTACMH